MNPPPIFIVGSPRSGTQLLLQLLDRHPALAICGETHFFPIPILYVGRRRQAFRDLANPSNRQRVVDQYLSTERFRMLRLDAVKVAEKMLREGTSYRALFASMLSYCAESRGKRRCGEKTPQHAFFAEALCEWFPGAVILHIVRDPRDVVASLQRVPFGFASAVLNARTWLKCNLAARRSSHRPGYLEVRYESLVVEPEGELRRICGFVGEEFSPTMLTAEQHAVLDRLGRPMIPVTRDRLGRWRTDLTPDQVALTEWCIGSQLEKFGYQREAPPASASTVIGGLSGAALDLARHAIPLLPAVWYYYAAPSHLQRYEYWRHLHLRAKQSAIAATHKGTL